MKKANLHLVIGTVICAATLIMFLVFYNQLPENVPVQITIDGTAGNTLPKPLLVFGFPVIFAVINLVKNIPLVKKENTPVYSFYIIPVIAVVLSVLTLMLALRVF